MSEDTSLDETVAKIIYDVALKAGIKGAMHQPDGSIAYKEDVVKLLQWHKAEVVKLLQVIEDEVIKPDEVCNLPQTEENIPAFRATSTRNNLKAEQRQALKKIKERL